MNYLFSFSISLLGLLFLIINTFLFVRNKAIHSKVSKFFIAYLVTLSVIEIACHVIGFLSPNSNFFISHFYFLFQFVFLSLLYYQLFQNKLIKKSIVFILILQLAVLLFIYSSNPQLFWNFNIYEIVSCSSILVMYALLYIFMNFENEHNYFNFSVGLILYLICSISIFTSSNLEMVLWEDPFIDIWIFNSIFYILFQYMIFREYKFFTKKKTTTHEVKLRF
jgi:hypothetical protein